MKQPVAKYTNEDFDRIVQRDYPAETHEDVRNILGEYGNEKWQIDPLRVRMACLKLADGDLHSLRKCVRDACGDYRDVLAWAEYPAYMRAHGQNEQEKAIHQDWAELQQWLHRDRDE